MSPFSLAALKSGMSSFLFLLTASVKSSLMYILEPFRFLDLCSISVLSLCLRSFTTIGLGRSPPGFPVRWALSTSTSRCSCNFSFTTFFYLLLRLWPGLSLWLLYRDCQQAVTDFRDISLHRGTAFLQICCLSFNIIHLFLCILQAGFYFLVPWLLTLI